MASILVKRMPFDNSYDHASLSMSACGIPFIGNKVLLNIIFFSCLNKRWNTVSFISNKYKINNVIGNIMEALHYSASVRKVLHI